MELELSDNGRRTGGDEDHGAHQQGCSRPPAGRRPRLLQPTDASAASSPSQYRCSLLFPRPPMSSFMSKPLSTKSSWPLHGLLGELMLVFQGAFGACFPGSLAGTAYERPAGAPSRILSEVSLLDGIPRPPSWPWPGKSSVGVAPIKRRRCTCCPPRCICRLG